MIGFITFSVIFMSTYCYPWGMVYRLDSTLSSVYGGILSVPEKKQGPVKVVPSHKILF